MNVNIFTLSFIFLLTIISCDNVSYEYGYKHDIDGHYYDNNIDTIVYNAIGSFSLGINQVIRKDTCFTYDKKGNLLSTSIVTMYYLDPRFLYVNILNENFKTDINKDFIIYVTEDNVMRKLKFSYNHKGPYPIFKVSKSVSNLELMHNEIKYKINLDKDYAFLYLFIDKENKLHCNYNDEPLYRK